MDGLFSNEQDEAFLPLRDVVFKRLREDILYDRMQPGERLMEVALANRLGVSRTPVREAVRMLEQEGLVEILPRRGARVAGVTRRQMEDILEARLMLETFAVRAACSKITEGQLAELKRTGSVFADAAEAGEMTALADALLEFRLAMVAAVNNDRIAQMYVQLKEQVFRYDFEYLKLVSDYRALVLEQERLIEAIEAGNDGEAAELVQAQIKAQATEIRRHIA